MLAKINHFLVKYLYKWLFPVGITVAIVLFARKDNNTLILLVFWLFHCLVYITIPWNFENPRKENFQYLDQGNPTSILWVLLQAGFLGGGLFVLTLFLINWYFPEIKIYSLYISSINGLLYSLSITLASYVFVQSKKITKATSLS
jgi:hypothetical protein